MHAHSEVNMSLNAAMDIPSHATRQNTKETDVLIIGSGPIGAVYARTIADASQGIKVLMVDIGEQETRLIGDHVKNDVAVQRADGTFTSIVRGAMSPLEVERPGREKRSSDSAVGPPEGSTEQLLHYRNLPAAPVIRKVGGMGSYWSCATPEQHPSIERSDLYSNEEWDALYSEAKALFHTTDIAFDHSIRHRAVKNSLVRTCKNRVVANLPLACERSTQNPGYVRWTGTATILGHLADPRYSGGKFELLSQHYCTRLRVDTESKSVVGAEIVNLLTEEVVLVRAKKYIVCGGAVLTAGLLFNSQIRQETGYPAFGRYLTEQTMAVCQIAMRRDLLESAWTDPRSQEYFGKFPTDPLRIPVDDPSPEITLPVSEEFPWHTQIQRDPFHYNPLPASIDPRLVLDLRFFGYVKPVYDNYVTFSSEFTDAYGMPQPKIHFRIGKEDAKRAEAMMQDMVSIASSLGDFLPGGEPKFLAPGAATHICGTTRAGREDDGHSVVDRNSKVWRLDNLFIGGCGVIPTQNACNPTLTAACFALVSARQVIRELKPSQVQQSLAKL